MKNIKGYEDGPKTSHLATVPLIVSQEIHQKWSNV